MAEMTKEFAERVNETGRRGEHSPLTPWEESQLAYGWLQWQAHLTQPAQAVDVDSLYEVIRGFGYTTRDQSDELAEAVFKHISTPPTDGEE